MTDKHESRICVLVSEVTRPNTIATRSSQQIGFIVSSRFTHLAAMSRSCSIKTLQDLTEEGGLRSLLQSHHGREDVLISDFGPFGGTGLVNAGFQSDIKRATVKYRVRHLVGN